LFGGSENDIAVSVSSMRHLAEGRELACEVRTVACDHMSYFSNAGSLEALSSGL
jgi:hypothetical protein